MPTIRLVDPATQGLVGAGMARAEVDDLEAVRGLCVGERHETIAGPYLVLGCFFSILDLGLHLSAIGAVELCAQDLYVPVTMVSLSTK